MAFDPFSSGAAVEEPAQAATAPAFDPFKSGQAAAEPAFDPFVVGAAQEHPDSIRQRLFAPGSTAQPTIDDARTIMRDEKAQPSHPLSAIWEGTKSAVSGLAEDAKRAYETEKGASATGALEPGRALARAAIGAGEAFSEGSRQFILNPLKRIYYSIQQHPQPGFGYMPAPLTEDQEAEKRLDKLKWEVGETRRQHAVQTGQAMSTPFVSPEAAQAAQQAHLLNPALSGLESNVLNPTIVLPAAGAVMSRAATVAGEIAPQVGKTVEQVALGAAGKAASTIGEGVVKPIDAAAAWAEANKAKAGAAMAGAHALGVPVAPALAAVTGAEKTGQGLTKVGEAAAAASQGYLGGQKGLLAQLSSNENAPTWLRQVGRTAATLGGDVALQEGADFAKAAGQGALVQGVIGAAGANTNDEAFQNLGAGAVYGAGFHVPARLAAGLTGAARYRQENVDLAHWLGQKDPAQIQVISGWSRDQALNAHAQEYIVNGIAKNSNVGFTYMPGEQFKAQYGDTRGVFVGADAQGQPHIFINADGAGSRTVSHEVYHAIQHSPDVVDTAEMANKMFPLVDASGQPLTSGTPTIFSKGDYDRFVDQYLSRFADGSAEKASMLSEQVNNPAAFRKRMVDEVSAELFANFVQDAGPGGILRDMGSATREALDWFTSPDQWSALRRMGEGFEKAMGLTPDPERMATSDIFTGMQNSPSINHMFREQLRQREKLMRRLDMNQSEGRDGIFIDRKEFIKPGPHVEKLLARFGDHDMFLKSADSPRPDKLVLQPNGTPILLSDREIAKVRLNRAKAMMDALSKVIHNDPHGMILKDNEAWEGKYFTDDQLKAIKALPDEVITPSMKARLEQINQMAKDGTKPILFHYNARLDDAGKYSSGIGETLRIGTPISMHISKASNFYINTFDHTATWAKMQRWFKEKGKAAYLSDFTGPNEFKDRIFQYLDNHLKSQPGMTGMDPDPVVAKRMATVINDFFNVTDVEHLDVNPDRKSKQAGKARTKDRMFRARRLDAINHAEVAADNALLINQDLQKINFMPAKKPSGGFKGVPKKLPGKLWIEPDGTITDTGGQLHIDWMANNAKAIMSKYKFDVSKYPRTEDDSGVRMPALARGFTRGTYDPNRGSLYFEVGKAGWARSTRDAIFMLVAHHAGKIDSVGINILDKSGKVIDGGHANLFTYSNKEKLNHLPLISEDGEGVESVRWSPPGGTGGSEDRPYRHIGFQEGIGKFPGFHLFNLTRDVPGVGIANSTVSDVSLRKAGFNPQVPVDPSVRFSPRQGTDPAQRHLGVSERDRVKDQKTDEMLAQGRRLDPVIGVPTVMHDHSETRFPDDLRAKVAEKKLGALARNVVAAYLQHEKGGITLTPEQLNELSLGHPKGPMEDAARRAADLLLMSDDDFQDMLARSQAGEAGSFKQETLIAAAKARQAIPQIDLKYLLHGDKPKALDAGSEGTAYVDNRNDRKWVYKVYEANRSGGQGFFLSSVQANEAGKILLKPQHAQLIDLISALDRFNRMSGTNPIEIVGVGRDKNGEEHLVTKQPYLKRDTTDMEVRQWKSIYGDRPSPETGLEGEGFNPLVGKGQPILRDDAGNAYATADVRQSNLRADQYGALFLTDGMIRPITSRDVMENANLAPWAPSDESAIRYSPKSLELDDKKINRYAARIKTLHDASVAENKGEFGGSTFNPRTGKALLPGDKEIYVVSIHPDRSNPVDGQLTKEQLAAFIKTNLDALGDPQNSVGTWFDGSSGKTYLDLSVTTPDKGFAEYLGKKYNQKAIWDLKNKREIPTGGTGDPIEAPPPGPERIGLAQKEYSELTRARGMDMFASQILPESMLHNVRDIEQATPSQSTPKGFNKVGKDINRDALRKYVQLLPTTDAKVRVRRGVQEGAKEFLTYWERSQKNPAFDSGIEWYKKDIEAMEKTTHEIFPQTKDPVQMTIFKTLLATLSPSQTPKENYRGACEAYAAYLQKGEFSAFSPVRLAADAEHDADFAKLGVQATEVAKKLNALKQDFSGDEAGMMQYLLDTHDKTKIKGEANTYGAYDLGPKVGAFFLNLNGISDAVTVDLWATRTWNRWMGTLFRGKEKIKTEVSRSGKETKTQNRAIQDAPTDEDRPLIQQAFRDIAATVSKQTGHEVSPMDVQATLWFFEKDLFEQYGAKVDRGSFGASAKAYQAAPIHQAKTPVTLKNFGKQYTQPGLGL